MTSAADFLRRIRAGIAGDTWRRVGALSPRPEHPGARIAALRRELELRWPDTLERFRVEFERVGGVVHRVTSVRDVAGLVARLARERGMRRVVTWHPSALGFDPEAGLSDEGLAVAVAPPADATCPEERDTHRADVAVADLGLTGVELAIAETGSLVVVSGAGRPRSTSLLPPVHVAVLHRRALVETLEQAGVFFEAWHADAPLPWRGGAITIITGPSRTADIELRLTRGVHGPGEVHGVFVDGAGGG